MGILSRGYFSTCQTILTFTHLGEYGAYDSNKRYIYVSQTLWREWYVLINENWLHWLYIMHRLEQLQGYREGTWLGWWKFKVTTQVQGHHQGHPMSNQCHSQGHIWKSFWRSFKVISRSNLKIARKVMWGHFKVTLINKVLLVPKLVRQISNAS